MELGGVERSLLGLLDSLDYDRYDVDLFLMRHSGELMPYLNPRGFAFWRTVQMQYPESRKRLIMDCIHYCSSSQLAGNQHYIRESPRRLLTVLCTPAGWLLTNWLKKQTLKG